MAKKVLLVEDDNNLREIYEARLQAEGYEIVSASDGEEALAVAKDAKPDLVISDVMMPKISGFEMLDILRNTDGLTDVKVIMLTALGQAEDKTRADKLGADRYLVKSQVTLEDIIKTAQQLLNDAPAPAASTPGSPAQVPPPSPTAAPAQPAVAIPVAAEPAPAVPPTTTATLPPSTPATTGATPTLPPAAPAAAAADDTAQTAGEEKAEMETQVSNFEAHATTTPPPAVTPAPTPSAPTDATTTANDKTMSDAVKSLSGPAVERPSDVAAVEVAPEPTDVPPLATVAAPAPTTPAPEPPSTAAPPSTNDSVTITHKKVIQPINDISGEKKDINALLAAEEAKEPLAPVMPTADNPAPVITPPPAAQAESSVTPAPNDPTDPNSIAL